MSKKAYLAWDEIIKWVLVIALILVLLLAIFKISGASTAVWERIKDIFRFGA